MICITRARCQPSMISRISFAKKCFVRPKARLLCNLTEPLPKINRVPTITEKTLTEQVPPTKTQILFEKEYQAAKSSVEQLTQKYEELRNKYRAMYEDQLVEESFKESQQLWELMDRPLDPVPTHLLHTMDKISYLVKANAHIPWAKTHEARYCLEDTTRTRYDLYFAQLHLIDMDQRAMTSQSSQGGLFSKLIYSIFPKRNVTTRE